MTIREFSDCIAFNIEHGLRHAVLGLGAPGVGKSEVIREIGAKFGYTVIDIRLAQMSEVEIGGLIYPNESRTKTVWLSPEILPDEARDGKKTILLLDEITSCPKRVQVAAYQLILDRRVGQYRLPEGTIVIALGNREDDDGVYIRLAGPLADRFEIHEIEPDFQCWKEDYALKRGVHPLVVDYLTFKPAALHTQAEAGENLVFATPRSWVRVSDILKIDDDLSNPVIRRKIMGNVGTVEGVQFIAYCHDKLHALVTADAFLRGAAAPDSPEEIRILLDAVADRLSFLSEAERLSPAESETVRSAIRAIVRLPGPEYVITGMKRLLELNRPAVQAVFRTLDDTVVTDFLRKNGAVFGMSDDTKSTSLFTNRNRIS